MTWSYDQIISTATSTRRQGEFLYPYTSRKNQWVFFCHRTFVISTVWTESQRERGRTENAAATGVAQSVKKRNIPASIATVNCVSEKTKGTR